LLHAILFVGGTCIVVNPPRLGSLKTSRGNEQEEELRRMPERYNHCQLGPSTQYSSGEIALEAIDNFSAEGL